MFRYNSKTLSCPVPEADLLFCEGRFAEAFDKYGKALLQAGDPSLTESAESWLAQEELISQVGELVICTFIARLTQLIDHCETGVRERLWEACLSILRGFPPELCTPRHDTTDRYVAECILFRHMKKPEDALASALNGLAQQETASRATFAGLCAMDMEDEKTAEKYIRLGLKIDPQNVSGCNDLADYYFNRRRFQKAAEYYEIAMSTTDRYDIKWSEPSLYFCRYMINNRSEELERLVLFAAMEPDNNRAACLCSLAKQEQQIPYLDYIPHSMDATANLIGRMKENNIKSCKLSLTCLEAASAIHALRLEMSCYGCHEIDLHLIVNYIPDPPLNDILVSNGIKLWNYTEGNDTEPILNQPDLRVQMIVKKLAEKPFNLGDWYMWAGEFVQELGAADIESLYGCMIYPSAPDNPDILASDWLLRFQYAAVCLLARIDKEFFIAVPDIQKYITGLPSPELARICLGQLDWPVIPALSLLVWQVREGIAPADTVLCIMDVLLGRVTHKNYCFFEHALVCALSKIPGRDSGYHQEMHRRRRFLEESTI